jgi:hypothetical protein
VPLERAHRLLLVAIIRGDEVRADQQQHNIGALKIHADCIFEALARRNPTVMPSRDEALPLEHRQVRFKLIAQRFVSMAIRKKQYRHKQSGFCSDRLLSTSAARHPS